MINKNISMYFATFFILLIITIILSIVGMTNETVKNASYAFIAILCLYSAWLFVYSVRIFFSVIYNTVMMPFNTVKYVCYDVPRNMYLINNGLIDAKEFMVNLSIRKAFLTMAFEEHNKKTNFLHELNNNYTIKLSTMPLILLGEIPDSIDVD
jgi:hypothetical protein